MKSGIGLLAYPQTLFNNWLTYLEQPDVKHIKKCTYQINALQIVCEVRKCELLKWCVHLLKKIKTDKICTICPILEHIKMTLTCDWYLYMQGFRKKW